MASGLQDPLVQVDYVGVVGPDIGASKSDICAVRVGALTALSSGKPPTRWTAILEKQLWPAS